MVKYTPRIRQLQQLNRRSKIMMKKYSKNILKRRPRSISMSHSCTHDTSPASKRTKTTTNEAATPSQIPVSPILEGYLPPPLPPPPSPEFLRRTVSNPTPNTEKLLSEEWIMVKFACECGMDCSFLVNKAGTICQRLL